MKNKKYWGSIENSHLILFSSVSSTDSKLGGSREIQVEESLI